MVPAVVALVVTVARVVVVVVGGGTVAAVVDVGGVEVDAVVAAGVDAAAVAVSSAVVVVAVVVAEKRTCYRSRHSFGVFCIKHQVRNQRLIKTDSDFLHPKTKYRHNEYDTDRSSRIQAKLSDYTALSFTAVKKCALAKDTSLMARKK